MTSTPLWDWALAAYARPGVAEACLKLQDEFGQNTCLLLWAWRTRSGDAALVARAAQIAQAWDDVAVGPLRAARRALKPPWPPVADHAREALRAEIAAAELHAERVLVETLERLGGAPGAGVDGLTAMKAASQAFGDPASDGELASLASALE
jgi:uncharacterized protein (TIGR02444 family)